MSAGASTPQVPVAEGVFTWPSEQPRLIGSRCRDCGALSFPHQSSCARCTSEDTEEALLERRGTLWTWTIQGFPPPSPPYLGPVALEAFEPFGVGYVELPGVKVETRLTSHDPARLRIGMPMEMVVVPIATRDDGTEVVTYAFAPIEEEDTP